MSESPGKQGRKMADELEEFADGWRRFAHMSRTPNHKELCLKRAEELDIRIKYLRNLGKREAGKPLKKGWKRNGRITDFHC